MKSVGKLYSIELSNKLLKDCANFSNPYKANLFFLSQLCVSKKDNVLYEKAWPTKCRSSSLSKVTS